MMPYGDRWRTHRRLCHEVLNDGLRSTGNFDVHTRKHTYRFLSRLLEAPERFLQEAAFVPGAMIMSVTYGIDSKSADDPLLKAVTEATFELTAAMIPGKFLVDMIPILRYLPDWFPGTGFKAFAKGIRDKYQMSVDGPMEYVKDAMKSGEVYSSSVTSDCLSRLEDHGETSFSEEVVRDVSGIMFAGAAETTKTVLQAFFLAMVLNPEVVKKAQEELDRVVGGDHLPGLADRVNLPYIDALIKEVLRWGAPAPIGISRRATQDDEYRGFLIPAGATVMQNVWAVCRNPDLYPDPETFNPDRFLKDGKLNPLVFNPEERGFGAGRRICPGRHFALRTVFLVVSCVLSTFDIEPALDENGNPQVPEPEFTSSTGSRGPKPFKCTIKPRSEEAIRLVKAAYDSAGC